jgi:hypothetical protein
MQHFEQDARIAARSLAKPQRTSKRDDLAHH